MWSNSKGNSDPYVCLKIKRKGRTFGREQQTPVENDTPNPTWGNRFTFKGVEMSDHLQCKIKDHDSMGTDDLLGRIILPLSQIPLDRRTTTWHALVPDEENPNFRGKLQLVRNL